MEYNEKENKYLRPARSVYTETYSPGVNQYKNALESKPDIIILQLGSNDAGPSCFSSDCRDQEPKQKSPDCISADGNPDTHFKKVQEGLV